MLPQNKDFSYTNDSANRLLILSSVGDDLIMEMIKNQLANPMDHMIYEDYLEILEDKRNQLLDTYPEDSDIVKNYNEFEDSIFLEIAVAAKNRYGINVDTNGDDTAYRLAMRNIYHVLYLDYRDTIVELFSSFIFNNRKGEIQEWIESKKDISSSSAKKTYKDIREALIMSNLSIIMQRLLEEYIEDNDTIKYLDWDSSNSMSIDAFINNYKDNIFVIDGNFYTSIITPYMESNEETEGLTEANVKSMVSLILYNNFQTEDVNIVGDYDPTLINDGEEIDQPIKNKDEELASAYDRAMSDDDEDDENYNYEA